MLNELKIDDTVNVSEHSHHELIATKLLSTIDNLLSSVVLKIGNSNSDISCFTNFYLHYYNNLLQLCIRKRILLRNTRQKFYESKINNI